MDQLSLFDTQSEHSLSPVTMPLADRLRPQGLEDYIGQTHLLGPGMLLRRMLEQDRIPSMIFWGPPGVGKTTLAKIIAGRTKSDFVNFSAVTSGIREIKDIMKQAEDNRAFGVRTLVFVDEIHRFNKAQQDAFLPYVEKGSITLIGATTENPSFEINAALLSRCKVFVLKELTEEDLCRLLSRALTDKKGFGSMDVRMDKELLPVIAAFADGDARTALNTLEMAVLNGEISSDGSITVQKETLEQCLGKKTLLYDKKGEEHYNLISALHKSMRNSDPDAAVYWLARMLEAGEDPLFIARRLIRFASEDVGLADSQALPLAVAAYQACHFNGMPECNLNLAQAVIYLSLAPRSNAVYRAYETAKTDALAQLAEPVPLVIRNAPTRLMSDLHYGDGYIYAHDTEEKIAAMTCLPESLKDRRYYLPTEEGAEGTFKERLERSRSFRLDTPPKRLT
ncbi:MAG: replication-associated recombination protein A [Butyrivibrio sp.]|nr:replication-associated recombination protein A [Acetatifactor muris]MCM1558346.1 replication-associated recombination protein A [Butyrivibrio sp.]